MTSLLARLATLDGRLSAHLALPPQAGFLRLAALAAAHSGDSLLWLGLAGVMLLWGGPAWRDVGWRIVAANLVGGAFTVALKWLFKRRRPAGESGALYTHLDLHSFPSGHAVRGAAMAVLLTPLSSPWGWALFPLWAGLVGLARIALAVHFTSDVVGGWGIGATVGGVLLLCF